VNINCGFLGIDDIGSGIHQFRALRVISHATSKLAFASACAFVRFGTLTTARHTYHSSACKIRRHGPQFHPFFLRLSSYAHRTRRILLAIIHATANSSPTSSSTSHSSRRSVLYNFPLSVTCRAALSISRSTSIFSPRLISDCPCGRHHPHLRPDIVLIASYRCHPRRRHTHRHRTRRVVLYNFPLSLRELR